MLFFAFAFLLAWLGTAAAAATRTVAIPRTLRQATRDEVIERANLYPDGIWTAKKGKRSVVSTNCGDHAGGGTCGCTYTDWCDTSVTGAISLLGDPIVVPSFAVCMELCDSTTNCDIGSWQTSTGLCYAYYDSGPTRMVANADFESGIYNPDYSCAGSSCSPYPPPGF